MVLFKDIAKASTDLLTKDFPHDKPWDVECKYKGSNPQFITCATATAESAADANACMKYSVNGVNSEIKVTSNGGALLDMKYVASKYVSGLTIGSRMERKAGSKASSDSVDVTCEYDNGRIHTMTQVNPINTTFTSSGMVTCNSPDFLRMGGEISGGVDMSALKYTVGASYTKKHPTNGQWTVGVKTLGDIDKGVSKVVANLHTQTPSSFSNGNGKRNPSELGVEVKHSIAEGKTGLTFGGLWFLDNSNDTSIKAKIGHDAMLAMAVSHRLSPMVTGVMGMQVNTMKMSDADSVKYGFKVYCKA